MYFNRAMTDRRRRRATCALLLVLAGSPAWAFEKPQIDAFIDEVVARHDLERQWVRDVLYTAEKKQSILDAISRPAERTRAWHEYRDLFVTEQRIAAGAKFWSTHGETLARVADDCGVPAAIIVGILGIETNYGRQTGGYRVVDALATLAFAYPPRAEFFRGELEQFLLLSGEHDVDPATAVGSYAGAMGAAQFISSSYRRYAVDASGDGRVDLWGDWRDVIGSVANYLHSFGWQPGGPVAARLTGEDRNAAGLVGETLELNFSAGELHARQLDFDVDVPPDAPVMVIELEHADGPRHYVGFNNFYVITRYNRSRMYAMAVFDLGNAVAARVNAQ